MANKMVSTIGAAIAGALALLWTITLTVPWDWLWSQNAINIFHVNLFSVYLDKRIVGSVVTSITSLVSKNAGAALNSMLKQSMWMETAVQNLCQQGVDSVFQWCDTWTMVKVGSLIMVLLGFMLVVLLASGGACMYYYAHYHATYNGRMAALVCFVAAPSCAVVGLLQYIVLTFQMGQGERQLVGETDATYGPGFFFACTLTVFTFVPLYIQVTFNKADLMEKYGDEEVMDSGVVYAPGYGAAVPTYVPSAPPPSNYGSAPGYQTAPGPPSNFGLPPTQVPTQMAPASMAPGLYVPGPAAPAPGSGAPAW